MKPTTLALLALTLVFVMSAQTVGSENHESLAIYVFNLPYSNGCDDPNSECYKRNNRTCKKGCGRMACAFGADLIRAELSSWIDQRNLFPNISANNLEVPKPTCRCFLEY